MDTPDETTASAETQVVQDAVAVANAATGIALSSSIGDNERWTNLQEQMSRMEMKLDELRLSAVPAEEVTETAEAEAEAEVTGEPEVLHVETPAPPPEKTAPSNSRKRGLRFGSRRR